MKRGALIAVEGLDGSGKSTQVERLVHALEREGREPLRTREPTDGETGRKIRALAASHDPVDPQEELRLFLIDREEHVREVIEPALAAGRLVVTDRYYLSTVAYQGAQGLDWQAILRDSEKRFPLPDVALLLEIDVERGLERVRARGGRAEPTFEDEDRLRGVAEIYRQLDLPYLVRIDADRDADAVQRDALAAIRDRLDV